MLHQDAKVKIGVKMLKCEKLSEQDIFKGRRVHLVTEEIQLPNGKTTTWELVKHVGAAAVIPVDNDGNIIMVKQYRNAADDVTLEIPAGTLDASSEDPKDCALRELEEETGHQCEKMEFLFKFYSSIGICDEIISIYVATGLKETEQDLDEDEFVEIVKYPLNELIDMCYDGRIMDNKTISSLLAYKHKYNL